MMGIARLMFVLVTNGLIICLATVILEFRQRGINTALQIVFQSLITTPAVHADNALDSVHRIA